MLNAVSTLPGNIQFPTVIPDQSSLPEAKAIYRALVNGAPAQPGQLAASARRAAHDFLTRQLQSASKLPADLPDTVHGLPGWIEQGTRQAGRQYREYLQARKAGAARRYFSSKSHALYFLRAVAPTKLVDGAWLYGLLQRWHDARFTALIRTYLEELGEGLPDKNHVVLYRKLLAAHGCEQWDNLPDDYYTQGAIQLALSQHADDFLPEVIGFNLGYEQLPLHLLITAYELNELDIDPYYFTLHVTVDNAATGHAKKAVQGLLDALPRVADAGDFYRRVVNGYKLNMLGANTLSIIGSFDLQQELLAVFAEKAAVGAQLHSDYCRVAGRTVNDWLAEPGQLPAFLASLEQMGWIRRHQDPYNSRFWKLIHGERAEMFGVFTAYEQQLIYDWIAGESQQQTGGLHKLSGHPRQLSFKARQRLFDTLGQPAPNRQHGMAARGVIRQHLLHDHAAESQEGFNADLRLLEEKLAAMPGREQAMRLLTGLMSPAAHHTPAGLMATRIFTRLFA